ncbi:MAG: AAA family ATPase [Bradyrhizobiaceae bacterium]|nr:AAA family ATPase [Bradyrhizobiaceae bacterium]
MTSDSPQGTIWDALNSWGQALPGWQRFVVSYAVRDGALSAERIGDAYAHFLRNAGLDDGTGELPAIPESVTGRADQSGSGPLSLVALKNLKDVNAIPADSALTFGPGITIVYGHNGTGKSGFARVLSVACFSREKPRIFPNVYEAESGSGEPGADIVIRQGNKVEETIAIAQDTENPTLKRVSVFDSSIARIHLSQETPLGFQPAGFDVFDEITRVIGAITDRLEADIATRSRENKYGQIFIGESEIAAAVAGLSSETDIAALRAQTAFGKAETDRLAYVDRQLAELRAKSPAEILKALASAKTDIETVRRKIASIKAKLGANACSEFKRQLEDLRTKTAAAATIDPKSLGNQSLRATGTPGWVNFIKQGRNLARAEKEDYPATGDPCLLCHRPLDEPSASLIRRFWGFLDDETRTAAERANALLNESVTALNALDVPLLPDESRLRADLSKVAPDVVKVGDRLSAAFEARRSEIVSVLDTGEGALPLQEIDALEGEFATFVEDIERREAALREGSVDEEINRLQAEHVNLRHRQVLNQNIDDIAAYVADQKWIEKAQSQRRSSLTTRFVTDKQRDLFRSLIEGRYKSRLEDECKALDCVLPIEFKARGSAGQTLRGIRIKGGHDPSNILSEGEQRAVALADFLTEVNLNPSSAGIVLDDPVTSMDHRRKRKIASRLAGEAKARQVVVFTHDLVFLSLLMEAAEECEAEIKTHWMTRSHDGNPGLVILDECPANSNAYKTTHRAREALARAKKSQGQDQVDSIRHGAAALRNTLEEIIIRDLFNGTVRRWDEQVRLGNVKEISWSDEVADEIDALQNDISRLIEAHSTSDEYAGGMPEFGDLEGLIGRVEAVQTRAKQRRK